PASKAKVKVFEFDFSEIDIKGRSSQGNIFTKYPVKKISFKTAGISTLGGINIYHDDTIGRLNQDKRGKLLGNFSGEDKILVIYKEGTYEITSFQLSNRYEAAEILLIEKLDIDDVISAVYLEGESKIVYVKRFRLETTTVGKKFPFITETAGSKLYLVTRDSNPKIKVDYVKGKYITNPTEEILLDDFRDVRGWKALGNKISANKVASVKWLAHEGQDDEKSPGSADKGFKSGTTVNLDIKKKKDKSDDQLDLF